MVKFGVCDSACLHGGGVKLAVGLRTRTAHGRPLAAVEHAELNAGRASATASHQAVERIDLADQMTLAEAADRRVARHRPDGREAMGDSAVRAPMRAAAAAASQPAWPPPTTITSKRLSTLSLRNGRLLDKLRSGVKNLGAVSRETCADLSRPASAHGISHSRTLTIHLPIQKSRKITSRISSTSTRPVSRASVVAAQRKSSAISSSAPDRLWPSAWSSALTVCSSARR